MSLLDLLNGVVTDQNDDYSPDYDAASGGAGGGKETMVKHIVAAYTRAAKGALLFEAPALMEKLKTERAKKAAQ